MDLRLSPRLQAAFPWLRDEASAIVRECRRVDRDLRTGDLLVEARCHPRVARFQGWAHPQAFSWFRDQPRTHENGRIQLVVGEAIRRTDFVRLLAHELRHIGQFHRGKREFGYLTSEHMTDAECENDAYLFEYKILDRLGIHYP